MLGMLVLALADLDVLLRVADVAGAMSTESLLGTDRAFAADLVGGAVALLAFGAMILVMALVAVFTDLRTSHVSSAHLVDDLGEPR